MFLYPVIRAATGCDIWNGMHIMPATRGGGGKPMEDKGARGQNRSSHAPRKAQRPGARQSEQAKEQRKLQAEDDCVVLLCRD